MTREQWGAGRLRGAAGVLLACLLLATGGRAQTPAAAAPVPAAPPVAIPVVEILPRADAALVRVRELEAVTARDALAEKIAQEFEGVREELIAQAFDTRRRLRSLGSLDALRSLDAGWKRRREQLSQWSVSLASRAASLDAAYAEASALRETWQASEAAARAGRDAHAALLARIDEVQAAVSKARKAISGERMAVLELQEQIGRELARAEAVQGEIAGLRASLERELLVRESLPLWTALGEARERGGSLASPIAQSFADQLAQLSAVWPPEAAVWLALLAIGAACLWLVFAIRQRATRLADEDPSFATTVRLFDRPYSVALVLAALVSHLLWREIPELGEELLRTLLLIPALRLLEQVVGPAARRPVAALAGFYVVDRARSVIEAAPLVERLVFSVEMAVACAVLAWLLRPARLRELPEVTGALSLVGRGLQVALALCGIALVANLIGYARLGFVIGDGAIRSLFIAVGFYASYRIADGMVAAARRAWPLRLIRALRPRPFGARERARRVLRIAAFAAWVFMALEFFTVRDEFVVWTRAVLGARLKLGELSLSLGGVVAFGLTLWAALLVSRSIRFVLEEDVFTRMRLPRGVPNAVTATIQYLAVLIGFFLALAVTGISLTQFTILAGAFGVGVGFGLQSVVNGFVSGLILLYERPIQVGDVVQIAELNGTVRRIGIRSSTLRTFEGAEVIVPNASLIAERFVNWTLSDRLRRIDIDIGVEYGSDPRRVLQLLADVAKANPSIMDTPAPLALFRGFGASALDFQLRAWTENLDDAAVVRSELCVDIVAALAAAGIEIPFPIYDVRLSRNEP